MNYSEIASKLSSYINEINAKVKELKGVDIDDGWAGSAHDNLSSNIKNCFNKVNNYVSYLNNMVNALNNAQNYKTAKENKENYDSQIRGLDSNASNYSSALANLQRLSRQCETNMSTYKSYANSSLNGIKSITSEYTIVDYEVEKTNIYMYNLDELLSLFQSGKLTKMSDGDSLYNYYSESEVDAMLASVHAKYTGRAAAINSVLGIIGMAANKGLKLDYDWGGGHVNVTDVDHLATGVDCSAFASWARNQGTVGDTGTTVAKGLKQQGTGVKYADAKPGDILASDSHAIFILRNDVENGRFICAEASGSKNGVVISTRSYSSLGGYSARDMSSYYGE